MQNITIETNLGDPEWELRFQQENIAKQFVETFKQQAAVGEAEEVRKVRHVIDAFFLLLFLIFQRNELTNHIPLFCLDSIHSAPWSRGIA
jgi:hypothetical protein